MANTLNLGNGNWATKEDSLLGYNSENNNFKPLPFDFTRASNATVVNKAGLIETVGSGEPRIDFLGNTNGALLLEPQRTNSITYSEDFSNAYWAKSGASVVSNATTSPDGSLNADKLVEGTGTGEKSIQAIATVSNATIYTSSVFVKYAGREWIRFTDAQSSNRIHFNTQTGVFGVISGTVIDYKSTPLDNGWYKISITTTSVATAYALRVSLAETDNDVSYTGDGTSGIYIYGAQLEEGSYATSYIPTQGSTVTRLADACNNGGNEQVINSTEGVLYAEFKGFISQDTIEPNRYITLTNGTSNERVALLLGGNTNQLRAIIYSSTQSINLSFTTSLTDVKQYNKLAVKYKSGDYAFFLNGVKIGGSSETNIFSSNTLNDLSFDVGGGTQQFRGNVKDVRVYNTALTDAELQALTTI